jgi:hypothetical protein
MMHNNVERLGEHVTAAPQAPLARTETNTFGQLIGAGSACDLIVIAPLPYSSLMFVIPKLMTGASGAR